MKILHTGDWHIGRTFNQHSLIEDQACALDGLITILKAREPDVLVVAGDLYDRSVPSREAINLVSRILSTIILDLKIPTIIIGGNHDGGDRLDFGNEILKNNGLYIIGSFKTPIEPIVIDGEDGPAAFWPVPFIKPVEYRDTVGLRETPDYNEMYESILEGIIGRLNPVIPNILITHGLVLSGLPDDPDSYIDDSVRPIEIGGISYADAKLFKDFDYTALGHLHRPQKVGSSRIRYAGSLLKYSFSEVNQHKSYAIVDVKKDTEPEVELLPVPYLHDVRIISGDFDELTGLAAHTQPNTDDYLRVILTNKLRVPNAMEDLRYVYPNIMEMAYENSLTRTGGGAQENIKRHLADPMALFSDFYAAIHGEEPGDASMAIVKQIFEEIEVEKHAAD